jgi:hypothetical protein
VATSVEVERCPLANREQRRSARKTGLERKTQLRRTPLRANSSAMARRVKTMRQTSAKRVHVNAKRSVVLTRLRASRDGCEIRHTGCTGAMDDGHEILTRARGGSITDDHNILMVCRPCHTWVTNDPADAACQGFVLQAWRADEAGRADAQARRESARQGLTPECADWCKSQSHREGV